jgi:hypothetical protein
MSRKLTRRHFLAAAAAGIGLPLTAACSRGQKRGLRRAAADSRAPWKAGVAKVRITPEKPVWLTGYGARTKPSEGHLIDLHAKALAFEDPAGNRAVLVTSDLLGFPAEVAANIARTVEKQFRLSRDRLMLTSSHTHGGPAVHNSLRYLYGARSTPDQWRDVEDYTRELERKVVEAVGAALKDLQPAQLRFGHTRATFGVNRRRKNEKGYSIGVNPEGPVDPDVPVLRVESPDGRLRGVVFGYACHNTTLGGDIYQFHGDYAGFAQAWLEDHHPGAVAFFLEGCGGDINPNPRGTVELAQQHGETLAGSVDQAIGGSLVPVGGPLKTAFERVPIPFAPPPNREQLEAELQQKDVYVQWHGRELLKQIERDGRLPATYPYPIQVWQFGRDLTLVALAGEVVVDYVLRLKKELGADRLWVAGYSNDVFAYIPSRRVLEEGGYEAGGAMTYYVQPGPFAPEVEEIVIRKIHEMADRVRAVR